MNSNLSTPAPAPPVLPFGYGTPARLRAGWRATLVGLVLAPAVLASGFFVHLDAYAISPGPAIDVGGFIRVTDHKTYPSRGAFLITTVSVTINTVNLFEAVRGWLDPSIDIVERNRLVAPGLNDRQQEELNRADMEQSKYLATVVALRASGLGVSPVAGARIVLVFPDTPASKSLRAGDVIVAVDGTAVRTVEQASAAIRSHRVGAPMKVTVLRGGRRATFTVRSSSDPSDPTIPVIGVSLAEAFRIPVSVKIDSQDIVGPSGGLVFALAIADALTPDDLTAGHRIAATGTISLDGTVGRIGGVAQKVRAAEYARADTFLVPADEEAEARAAARDITIIGVSSIGDAVRRLEGLAPAKAA